MILRHLSSQANETAMQSSPEPRRTAFGSLVFAMTVISLMAYLTFAALQGEHGLFRLVRIEAEEIQLRSELAELQGEVAVISNKTRRLSERGLDLELLDEQARKVLGLGHPDEIILR